VDLNGELRCTLVSLCRGEGDLCSTDADCCSGVCGADGLCPVMAECQTVGEPCTGFHECCTGLCADPGTGVPICQFISGCRPIGEICQQASDCCSALCEEYEGTGVLRCVKPGGCMSTGEVCQEGMSANCCPSGPDGGPQLCLPTVLGLSRCWGPDSTDQCIPDGQPCTFADECCGGLCLPDANGDYFCGSVCVPLGDTCTADADCCDGICWGAVCIPDSSDCEPVGAECTTDDDCCSGFCDPVTQICTGMTPT